MKDSGRRLFVRRVGSADTIEVPGTTGAQNVACSPDGANLALVPGRGSLTTLFLDQVADDYDFGHGLSIGTTTLRPTAAS